VDSTTSPNTDQAWRAEAKCARPESYPEVSVGDLQHPAGEVWHDLFFPPRDKALYKPVADKAKALCYGKDGLDPCPVRRECLLAAMLSEEPHGILGGKSHRERNAIERRRVAQHPELSLEDYVRSDFCR